MLLIALGQGRPGAVLVHILLPWLLLALIESVRSWTAAAAAALLFAGVTAASPILALPLALAVIAWAAARPRGFVRIIGVLIPAAVLFAPLIIDAIRQGSPLAVLADPGLVVPAAAPSGWELVIGLPQAGVSGWEQLLAALGIAPGIWSTLAPAVLLSPLAALALLALFLPGARRSIPALILATLGLATAWISTQLHIVSVGPEVAGPWAGAPLSLYWIGIVGAAVVTLDVLGRSAGPVGVLSLAAAVLAVIPALAAPAFGSSPVHPGDGRVLPALAAVVASEDPGVGTLVLTPYPDGTLGVMLQRGDGATLDDQSALHAGRTQPSDEDLALAELAGNLASRGGYDPAPELQRQQIRFVLVEPLESPATEEATAVRERAVAALDASPDLAAESDSAYGTLWSFGALERTPDAPVDRGAYGATVLAVQGIVALLALLLAIPTRRRRRVVETSSLIDEPAATTFDEDTDG